MYKRQVLDSGTFYMSNIELLIGQSSTEAERKRAARLQNKALSAPRTNGGHLSDIRPPEIEIELEKEIEICLLYTSEEVIVAAKAAQCDEFISKLPDGYQTVIGENGSTLSGGECQRLSIARALLKDAPVILLDEATASLDVDNETEIQNAIARLVKGKTVLIIAHRMRTVEAADNIVVLSDGIVAENGTHEELMKENGLYHRLVDLQTASANWKLSV